MPLRDNTWELLIEYNGGVVVTRAGRDEVGANYDVLDHAPMEVIGAVRFAPKNVPFIVKAGLGPGLTSGFGTPDVRAFIQLGPGKMTESVKDSDKDGLLDDVDLCPLEPEDADLFMDDDGCPDFDNDGDGVVDVEDDCMMDPEDADGFEDANGCPDLDNDQDGVPDVRDGEVASDGYGVCRDVPEDKDDFESEDGCPDRDNDRDGIPDTEDGHRAVDGTMVMMEAYYGFGDCMNEPEVVNGVDDDDGCPDEALARVDIVKREIVIIEKVYFDYNKSSVRRDSNKVLDAVVLILLEYPTIGPIEIQGHTDARGSASYNLSLSQKRVDAVREYLIRGGVDPIRLVSKGYGETQLIHENAADDDQHQENRRVQFMMLGAAETEEIEVRVE